MNLEEARKVLWLKSNPRPMGELLDQGYITKERLEWAAQWAYNPKQKQAAQILLEAMKSPIPKVEERSKPVKEPATTNPFPIGMSLEKARATLWPLPPFKGQVMGTLVESRQLSLKDLGYAIENAWDGKVRQAATALMLTRLDQLVNEPVPSAGFVKLISGGRSFSERQETRYTLLQGMFFGIALASMFAIMAWDLLRKKPTASARPISEIASSPNGMASLVIALLIIIFLAWLINFVFKKISDSLDRKIELYRLGQEGEDRTMSAIVQALDGNWAVAQNVDLPGRNRGDLDLVLVGPPGVWVLEVKNYNGIFRNQGEKWEIKKGGKWKTAFASPSRQAKTNAVRLAEFLKADKLDVFVNGVVVWANPESPLSVENPATAVWLYNRLADEIGNIWQGEKLSKEIRERIVDKLSKLCKEQRKG